mgnify:CR=1 FL=1
MAERVRQAHCSGCPFNRAMSLEEAGEVLEGPRRDPACSVLCHTSGFEDDAPHELCAGYRRNAERLGLIAEART